MLRDGKDRQNSLRYLPVVVALMLLVVGGHKPAAAGKVYPAWVIPDVLNVRSGPGTDRKLVTTLTKGTKVYVTAFVDNWCWAKLPDGRWGWISEPLLQFSAEKGRQLAQEAGLGEASTNVDPMPAWVQVDTVKVRSGPGTNYQERGTLSKGTKVYIVEIRNDWRKCRTPGGWGWIRQDMLETDADRGRRLAEAAGSGSGGSAAASSVTRKAYVNGDGVRLRSGPGKSYRIKATLVRGQTLYVTETRGEWCKVTVHGGSSGWVHADFVKYETTAGGNSSGGDNGSTSAKGYVIGGTVHLRAGPGTGHRIRAKLVEGQTVYITEKRGEWYRVRVHGGEDGWIHSSLVKLETGDGQTGSSQPQPTAPAPSPSSGAGCRIEGMSAWIAEDNVNVRYGPGTEHEVKLKLSKGEKVEVLQLSGHWCKVKTGSGAVGWVAGWVMNFKGPGEDVMITEAGQDIPVRDGWVARPEVNIRSGPGTNYASVAEATLGAQVLILDRQGDWYKVVLDNGVTGWVASWLVDTRAQRRVRQGLTGDGEPAAEGSTEPGGDSSLGQRAVEIAMRYLGARYVRGTSGPNTFDCSGFTSFCYRQLGIDISRSSSAQAYEGREVPRDQLQVGDIIVFKNTYRAGPSHVGLYIGNGRFIHASNSRRGVVIDSLDSDYYAPRYHSARRVY